ncbi:MAG: UvrD-helicase domain-containing protein [Thermoplasmata archaeon]
MAGKVVDQQRMKLDREKENIIKATGNVLVIANPGTGKTELIARKYADLVASGVNPSDILCLTFTKKAMTEMEERISKILSEEGINTGFSNINVFTFHSYCNQYLDDKALVSPNLLRYSIFNFLKNEKVFNYEDDYLIGTIVPKIENAIRYLKTYGMLPDSIDLEAVKCQLGDFGKTRIISKREMDFFAEKFVAMFDNYEKEKGQQGIDYADMVLKFLQMGRKKIYKYVLIDELQDINSLEARVALDSSETFFAVGDRKQAIFGFQGGSVANFDLFRNSSVFVLHYNHRSTNEIIAYAREYYQARTKNQDHRSELSGLANQDSSPGQRPTIIESSGETIEGIVPRIIKQLEGKTSSIGILVRKNAQIKDVAMELERMGYQYRAVYSFESDLPMDEIVTFLKGLLGNDVRSIRAAMLTPFFPISLKDAFNLLEPRSRDDMGSFLEKVPEFRTMRESIRNVNDLDRLFMKHIIPVSASYGKEYFTTALSVRELVLEAISVLKDPGISDIISYVLNADYPQSQNDSDSGIFIETVHGAKGRQFDAVIYLPSSSREYGSMVDEVKQAILISKGINPKEEIEEEDLRIDFVAMTRSMQYLYIIPDPSKADPGYYVPELSERIVMDPEGVADDSLYQRYREAYNLFVSGDPEGSRKVLQEKEDWVISTISEYFGNLRRLSYSSVSDLQSSCCDFLIRDIINVSAESKAMERGTMIHSMAEMISRGEEVETTDEYAEYRDNVKKAVEIIKRDYPEPVGQEISISVPINTIIDTTYEMEFKGKIDALFRNNERYLIVDWKTDKTDDRSSHHRAQLELYRKMLSSSRNIDPDKIDVGIGFVALRNPINLLGSSVKIDITRPNSKTLNSFLGALRRIINMKDNPEIFLMELQEENPENHICRSIVEEYVREKRYNVKSAVDGIKTNLDSFI